MNNRIKNALYSLVLIVAVGAVWLYRNNSSDKAQEESIPYTFITGKAQGTTYNITYQDEEKRNFKKEVDSLLLAFDKSLSTYREYSEISYFNKDEIDSLNFKTHYFYPVLEASQKVYEASKGAFDPTIYPLIKAWGFGKDESNFPDTATVQNIKTHVGFDKIAFNEQAVWKKTDDIGLNFNAIAQGYAIDVLFDYITGGGVENVMIELGGEVRAAGVNDRNEAWSIGIDNPQAGKGGSDRAAIVKLKNQAVSTSGNYRNFFVKDGVTYGHTIDPRTGFPVQRDIISATVLAPDCMQADAWSTAFMVLGLQESKVILKEQPQLKAYFIYIDENGTTQNFVSEDLKDKIILGE